MKKADGVPACPSAAVPVLLCGTDCPGGGLARLLHSRDRSSPIGVPVSVVVTQKVIFPHHLVSGDFQRLVNRRQEIFT